MVIQPLARSYLWQDAAAAVRRAIVAGALGAGERVSEAQLAEQLGVSRMPARDAMRVLVQEGLLAQRGGVTVVVGCSERDLRQLYEFRLLLEVDALRALGAREDGVAEEAAQELRLVIGQMRAAAGTGGTDEARLTAADLAFHRALVAAAGNQWLLAAWERLAPTVEAAVALAEREDGDWDKLAASHERLLELVLGGAVGEAERDLRQQLKGGGDQLIRAIRKARADGSNQSGNRTRGITA